VTEAHTVEDMAADHALAGVRIQLEQIEAALLQAAEADSPMVTEAARHIIAAGGKRFRPLLVVLGSHIGPYADPDDVVKAAVVVELTHVGSLYHDDVMDEAELRRGSDSANARWGNTVAILVGDLLFARASDTVAALGPEFVQLQARTFSRLVQGQIAETVGPADGQDPLDHYLQVVADKTGSLIATCGRFGALLSGAPEMVVDELTRFGERIGVAFQLSDDLLDVASDATEFGKTPGTDLREGVATLPVLHALASTDPADARLQELLRGDLTDDARHAEALGLLRANRAMELARADLQRWADDARAVLAPLPDIPARALMELLCDVVVARTA
jgi:heptaprenyl diphosphate synthase